MNRFEKAAYGGDDEYGEYDRWSDGGPAWGLNKQKMIDMTRLFAAEAARRKAQLQFHSDRYGADMYSPEEAVKRISAVANDKDLDDVENLPNYYNLQYPLKPRSGILETLRLKSPGPIDDWGPDGHPMEAVNRALMGMRSRSGSLKKAAYVGREDYNGEYDRHGEYDRWYDDEGPALGLSKKKMIDMTRLFAAEAAKHKAKLQFHSDQYGDDEFSPEEAVRRIEAASRPERIDYEESPNYYSLQYPLKPRSGILETLRLKSPAPIDWGPDGHPKEVVNRAIMGMRSGSLKKAASFGAMMGKRAAEIGTPSGKPAAAPKGPSLNSTPPSGLGGNSGGMGLSGGRPQFNQGAQNDLLNSYTNFQKNNPSTANVQYPAPVQGGSTRYKNNEEMTRYARQADLANKKVTWQQVEQMNPGEKMIYDRRSRPSNEQIASDQLAGKVNPNANSPFKPSGPPLSAKNQEMANMKHYTEQAYTDRQNLRPGSVAAERSSQQNKADEAAGAIPNFIASTAAAGPLGEVLGAGAGYLGGKILPKIAPAFARWAAPVAHDAAHVAGHVGASSLLPASYAATPTSIKGAPAWLAGKGVHAVEHQLHNVPHALERGKGALEEFLNRSKPAFSGDVTNPPLSGEVTNVPRG